MIDEMAKETQDSQEQIDLLKKTNKELEEKNEFLKEKNIKIQKKFMVEIFPINNERTKKQFTVLEIENEKFENETRVKDSKITDLENNATILTEKLLMLKLDFQEREDKGQQMETRFKDQLNELTQELEVLKKKTKHIFLLNQKNKKSGSVSKSGHEITEQNQNSFNESEDSRNRVSIMIMGKELEHFQQQLSIPKLKNQTSNMKSNPLELPSSGDLNESSSKIDSFHLANDGKKS